MKLDWDPEVDTPATIAIIGGGPVGIEAALYARFLGYFVMVIDNRKVGDSLLGWNDYPIPNSTQNAPGTWRDCTTPLGLAALEAQSGSETLPHSDAPVSYRQYVEMYLLPVARTDLLYESIQVHSRVRSISRVGCSPQDTCTLERRSEQEFRLLIDSKNRGEFTQLADIVLDCSGMGTARRGLASGGGRAIGESLAASHMWTGKCDIRSKHRDNFSGKHCVIFGNNIDACANALELLQVAQDFPNTRLTWVLPKRIGVKGFELPTISAEADAAPNLAQKLINDAQHAIENELEHLVPIAAWGIEALSFESERWSIKLQSTAEETLDIVADVFINCADYRDECSYREELLADVTPLPDAITLTGEPHYYRIGQRAWGRLKTCTFADGFAQIRQTFGLIGGRQELDLYATVKPSR